jgi:threonine aldolase
MGAEALIVMRPDLVADVPYLRKQQTQLASKMRFVAAQFSALLHDDLWRLNAGHANAMARRLAAAVADIAGITVTHPVEANAVFAQLPAQQVSALLSRGWFFHPWDEGASIVRWMTAFDTSAEEVDAFAADIRATARA